jgi:hypothetical protein
MESIQEARPALAEPVSPMDAEGEDDEPADDEDADESEADDDAEP